MSVRCFRGTTVELTNVDPGQYPGVRPGLYEIHPGRLRVYQRRFRPGSRGGVRDAPLHRVRDIATLRAVLDEQRRRTTPTPKEPTKVAKQAVPKRSVWTSLRALFGRRTDRIPKASLRWHIRRWWRNHRRRRP